MCFSFAIATADEPLSSTYGSLVDDAGNITLPANFRTDWTFLGTWSIAEKDVDQASAASNHGAAGLHNVYTQRKAVDYFRNNGSFPDGAVLIKELLKAETGPMTTGTVSRGTQGTLTTMGDTRVLIFEQTDFRNIRQVFPPLDEYFQRISDKIYAPALRGVSSASEKRPENSENPS